MTRLLRLCAAVPALLLCAALLLCSASLCGAEPAAADFSSLTAESEMTLLHAEQFSVSFLTGGYRLITIGTDQRFLVVPEGVAVPGGVPEDIRVLRQPLTQIYMVSTSSMDYVRALDSLSAVTLSSQKRDSWYLPEVREAMDRGEMCYAGKYSAPDYELLLARGCDLAVENTMIYHTPEVREQLEQLGIPVLVDLSGYESDPLGRMEWVRLYGVLLGREAEADACYASLLEGMDDILSASASGKTCAFFYITTSGTVNVRRSGDYVAKALEMAGVSYIAFDAGEEDSALSTQTVTVESFYAGARDADILIYNSTVDSGIGSLEELLDKCPLLADFKAVKEGNVWCLGKNFYQEPLSLSDLIRDVHSAAQDTVDPDTLTFLTPVR